MTMMMMLTIIIVIVITVIVFVINIFFIVTIIITIIIIVKNQHYPYFTARTDSIKSKFQISCFLKNHALLLSYQRPWMLNSSDLPYEKELYINIHGEAYITRKVNSYPKIDIT